jgi:two-component system sensor histidine kinase BaeS
VTELSLRTRLVVAFVAVALLAVGLAALIGNLGLSMHLDEAARTRLKGSATHVADIAAAGYSQSGAWNRATRTELVHVGELDDLNIAVISPKGQIIQIGPKPAGTTAQAPIMVGARRVGIVVVSAYGGSLLTPEEQHLANSLDRLHVVAAGAAVFAALLAGLLLAQTLTRPLRHIRTVAERLEEGQLDARVDVAAEPELRAVGGALNRLAETLQHEEELRRQSVADLSHELRTPVAGMLGRIEAAEDGVLPLQGNLAAMHADALRLTQLLDDLARLADAQRPGLLLEKAPVDLGEVAELAVQSFALRAAESGIGLDAKVERVWIAGDAGRLTQVVSNLMSNALWFTEPGGRVTVTVGRSGATAVVEVADNGIGVAPEDLTHIFTRFWRGDRSRSRVTGGSGIGLAIVHELVRAHDGRIDVESTPGIGSRFRVELPALADSSTPPTHSWPYKGASAPIDS